MKEGNQEIPKTPNYLFIYLFYYYFSLYQFWTLQLMNCYLLSIKPLTNSSLSLSKKYRA
jgi:hypothetical protein